MIAQNGALSRATDPWLVSWLAHGSAAWWPGSCGGWPQGPRRRRRPALGLARRSAGALTVVLAALCLNSPWAWRAPWPAAARPAAVWCPVRWPRLARTGSPPPLGKDALAALLVMAGALLIVLHWERHHDLIDPAGTAERRGGEPVAHPQWPPRQRPGRHDGVPANHLLGFGLLGVLLILKGHPGSGSPVSILAAARRGAGALFVAISSWAIGRIGALACALLIVTGQLAGAPCSMPWSDGWPRAICSASCWCWRAALQRWQGGKSRSRGW